MAEKCSMKELDVILKEQALINELLCSENIVGRWKWRSGTLLEKTLVPWEDQAINTLVDNFKWEKNDYCITVEAAGLYEVVDSSAGLFRAVRQEKADRSLPGQRRAHPLSRQLQLLCHSPHLGQAQRPQRQPC